MSKLKKKNGKAKIVSDIHIRLYEDGFLDCASPKDAVEFFGMLELAKNTRLMSWIEREFKKFSQKQSMSKFIQIVSLEGELYALDDEGQVWYFIYFKHYDKWLWKKQSMKREKEDEV